MKHPLKSPDNGAEPTNPSTRGNTTFSPVTQSPSLEIGVDSFAAAFSEESQGVSKADRLLDLVKEIEHADQVGLDSFGVGEHHRREFLDSAQTVILGAAAVRTKKIRLTSAVTVLGSSDPVRVFESFATVDLLSRGRAEMVVGRGSSVESFPLFGYSLDDYDELFAEKLELLLEIRKNENVYWTGKFRPSLDGQGVYPETRPEPVAHLAGRRRDPTVICPRGSAGASPDGRDHRRRDPQVPATSRPLPGVLEACGPPARADEGRSPFARLCRRDKPAGCGRLLSRVGKRS